MCIANAQPIRSQYAVNTHQLCINAIIWQNGGTVRSVSHNDATSDFNISSLSPLSADAYKRAPTEAKAHPVRTIAANTITTNNAMSVRLSFANYSATSNMDRSYHPHCPCLRVYHVRGVGSRCFINHHNPNTTVNCSWHFD